MPYVTAICYLFSLVFYGIGYLEVLVLKNAVTEYSSTYDYNIHVSLATSYFVLAIVFTIIGTIFFCVKNNRTQAIIEMNDPEFRGKIDRESDDSGLASLPQVKAQLVQY